MLALATALRAFDSRLFAVRSLLVLQHDALVHYNMLLTWWRHGDSPRGFTLTPSPYFIDMLVQFPIMLIAPDFERFSYALGCTYALMIFGSLCLLLRRVLALDIVVVLAIASVTITVFYLLAPFNFVVHAFVVNHTSEVFTTLGMLALLHAWFRPDAARRAYTPYVYALLVVGCVASSPFFIATYCLPAIVAAAAILGTSYLDRRRFCWFLALTVLGACIGLLTIAIVSRYVWPVRGDHYQRWWRSYLAFKAAIAAEPGGRAALWISVVACVSSVALLVVGRRCKAPAAPLFMLAFFPAAVIACVAIPIKRGAFDGAYAFRYVTFPWLLVVTFYVSTAAWGIHRLLRGWSPQHAARRYPRWFRWSTGLFGAAGLALLGTCHGSFTMAGAESLSAPMIACFREVDQRGELRDGLSTWWLGRFFIAARLAPGWRSPNVIVEIRPDDGRIDPWDNNVLWFADGFRQRKGQLNFLVTFGLGDAALEMFRERVGTPDRTISCAVPANQRLAGKPTFEIWIWTRAAALQRLTQFILADNGRGAFSPVLGATSMSIDPIWGMESESGATELTERHRVWRRQPSGAAVAARILPMYVPSGRYRLALEVATVTDPHDPRAAIDVVVQQEHHGEIARTAISPGMTSASLELDIDNLGGPTSGDAIEVRLVAGSATSIDLAGATLTLVDERGVSPFRIFR